MKRFIIFICLVVFTGCSSVFTNVSQKYKFDENSKKSLVMGRISCSEFGWMEGLQNSAWLRFKRKGDHKAYSVSVDHSSASDFFFGGHKENIVLDYYLLMEPGEYHIERIFFGKKWELDWPGMCITVPEKSAVLYVGNLQIRKSGKTGFWGSSPVEYKVIDEKDQTFKEVLKALPNIGHEVTVRLIEKGSWK